MYETYTEKTMTIIEYYIFYFIGVVGIIVACWYLYKMCTNYCEGCSHCTEPEKISPKPITLQFTNKAYKQKNNSTHKK